MQETTYKIILCENRNDCLHEVTHMIILCENHTDGVQGFTWKASLCGNRIDSLQKDTYKIIWCANRIDCGHKVTYMIILCDKRNLCTGLGTRPLIENGIMIVCERSLTRSFLVKPCWLRAIGYLLGHPLWTPYWLWREATYKIILGKKKLYWYGARGKLEDQSIEKPV